MYSQNSDIKNRAKKYYKNKHFELLLRELIANGLHSVLLSAQTSKKLKVDFIVSDSSICINIEDNGDGFNNYNFENFKQLDKYNTQKITKGFKPLGQGRLSIVYFAGVAKYTSIYKENDKLYKREFDYPAEDNLFSNPEPIPIDKDSTILTKCFIDINSENKKAKHFFDKHQTTDDIERWFYVSFFPLISNNNIDISISLNNDSKQITPETIPNKYDFIVYFEGQNHQFTLYIVNIGSKKSINCCARGLLCNLNYKIKYDLTDVDDSYFLTSDYFDNQVELTGDRLYLEERVINAIEQEIHKKLNHHYKEKILENINQTAQNIKDFKANYPAHRHFVDEIDSINEVSKNELLEKASIKKSQEEIKYWAEEGSDYKDRIIESSLFNYIKYREDTLNRLEKELKNATNIQGILSPSDSYFKHNLWLIDDRYSFLQKVAHNVFCDNDEVTQDVVIIEQSGKEIDQVKNYAIDFYKENQDIQSSRYCAIIVASDDDINGLYRSADNAVKTMDNSYYLYSKFHPTEDKAIPIKIVLISYNDVYTFAKIRNEKIINLMRNE